MPRLLVLLTLLLLGAAHVAQLPGLREEHCTEACEDDDAQGHCAPACQDCACCVHQPPLLLTAVAGPALAAPLARPHTEAPTAQLRPAHGRKIPHIPRRALA